MAKYAVSIKEILKRTVIVEAEDLYEALQVAENAVNQDEIILDVDDFDERTIEPSEYWEGGEVPENADVSFYYHLNGRKDSSYVGVGLEEGGEDFTVHKTMDWVKANLGSSATIEEEKCPICGGILVTHYGAGVEMTTCVDCDYEDFDYD